MRRCGCVRCMTEEVVGEKSWWQLSMGDRGEWGGR